MKTILIFIFSFCLFINFSAKSALETEESQQSLSKTLKSLEHERNLAKTYPEFERLSRTIAPLLPQALEGNMSLHQALFSLLRTRHYFFGMPRLVPTFCGDHNEALELVDKFATHAWHDADFQEMWKEGISESCYDSKILEAIAPDFKDECGGDLTKEILKSHKPLLDLAFSIYEVFAPKLTIAKLWDFYATSEGLLRGWTIEGLDPSWIPTGEDRQIVYEKIAKHPLLPLSSKTSWAVPDENILRVTYYFSPWMIQDDIPLIFSLTKPLKSIHESVQELLSKAPDLDLEKEGQILKKAHGKSSDTKQKFFETALKEGIESMTIRHELGLLFKKNGNLEQAKEHFRVSANLGCASAQDHYGLLIKEEHPKEAALYFKAAAQGESPYGLFRWSKILMHGEGGEIKRDYSRGLVFLKDAADLGHDAASYIYALELYKTVLDYIRQAADKGINEARDFLGRLPPAGEN